MKKIIGILVSVSMVFSAGVPAFASPEPEDEIVPIESAEAESGEDSMTIEGEASEPAEYAEKISYIDGLSLELSYDDRYDLSELGGRISQDEEYVIYTTEYADGQGITSYQVSQGTKTEEADNALLTLKKEAGSNGGAAGAGSEVVATGVGSGTVWLVRADQEEDLRKALEGGEDPDSENPKETIDVYRIAVTVEPATLTLMILTGQSNMEGYCDSYTGYTPGSSIVCEEGDVYSTYVPWGTSKGKEITGIDFREVCTTSNYRTTAGDFVAGSLQGAATDEGTLCDPSNMSGGTLEYPLNSLSGAGGGKTGSDSGLAYEWNRRTGDKVWVVNTAYGATEINQWVPGGNCYDRSAAVWEKVLQTYQAELAAGHYTAGSRLAFWEQGETNDSTSLTAVEYEESFGTMYNAMAETLGIDALGIFMVRAGHAGSGYQTDGDLKMSGPRIAQYWLGSGNSPYDSVFVASNANEQWVSNSQVKSYFQNRYGSALSYPTQSGTSKVPTTVNEVHYDIHFSQIGHNENGITAADGMVEALTGTASPESISWRDSSGKTISSLKLELTTDTAIVVPVADPVYTAKQLTCNSASGNVISYDAASGVVQAKDEMTIGTENLVASAGRVTGTLPVTVSVPLDLSGVAGPNYTGLFLYKGVWWYLKNGIIQIDYEGVEKNDSGWWYVKDGRVDYTYTGFAQNSNGWWYIEDGKVTFAKTDVIKDMDKKIDGGQTWWYVEDSKVQFDYNGFAKNSNGWWYIENGKVTFTKTGVIKDTNEKIDGEPSWWYVDGSRVQFDYTGFADNANGWWYIENGKVTFAKTDVIKDTDRKVDGNQTWWYVEASKVQFNYNGFAKNSNGWWYIENGKVTFTKKGVIKDTDKKIDGEPSWWYVDGSYVQFSYNGFGENSNGKWYIENGKVTFNNNSVLKDTTGAIGTKGTWYYVVGSKVQTGFTGLANYKNENGWWYIRDGKVDFNANTVAKNVNGWYYVVGGKVRFDFTGLADYKNENGWWYIKGGKVDFTHSGVDKNKNGWYYMEGGKVIFSYNGIAQNANGWWYIQDGRVDFSFTGRVTISGITYPVTNGRVTR